MAKKFASNKSGERDTTILQGKKVLVTGASGFTGALLVRKLISRGAVVRANARATSNLDTLKDLDIEWIIGDVFDPKVIDEAVRDVEYVFHLASGFRDAKLTEEGYRLVHLVSTQLLAKRVSNQKNFKRFIHISTVGVHGHIERPPADEEYPFDPGDDYQRTKADGEIWIREFAKETDLPLTVIRPTPVYGPGDLRLLKLYKIARMQIVPLIGNGNVHMHLIHVEDLTDIIIHASEHPKAVGEVFICGDPEALPLKEIIKIISTHFGKNPRFIHMPTSPFFLLGSICENIFPRFNLAPPIFKRRVAFFTKNRSFNTEKMRNMLGFEHQYDCNRGLIETAEWYVKSRLL